MTTWTGRPPLSYSQVAYDDHVLYDSHILYSGVAIQNTSWTGRTTPGSFSYYTWGDCPDTWAGATYTWGSAGSISSGTAWTGRTIPN